MNFLIFAAYSCALANMADEGWVLWYWGTTFKGRGEYVRLVFEAAGVEYTENNDGAEIMSRCDLQGHKGKG